MLVSLKSVLQKAKKNLSAVGSFNVYSLETIGAVIDAGKKLKEDVIVSFGASYLKNMSLEQVYFLTNNMAEGENKVVLHLDHCEDIEIIKRAINVGFTSVMYDGSALSFEENLRNTKIICDIAHDKFVSVEAELGSLALGDFSNETDIDYGEVYTNPIKAKEFVERTGCDALAVSIGTVHGMYKCAPNIRIDILKEINQALNIIPLVLHGGSGTPKDKLIECINNGICKINVNTEISRYVVSGVFREIQENSGVHLSNVSLIERRLAGEIVEDYIKLFKNDL